jgi:FKBP-type peptidyl-prolyl cis-trans isomerase SlyD
MIFHYLCGLLFTIHFPQIMKISVNKFVSATYDLYVGGEEGSEQELMEKATEDRPLSFIFGTGMMLEGFENNLAGLTVGESFDFTLSAENAYGEYVDENVVDLPKSIFETDGKIDEEIIFENNTVPMVDQEGNRLNGTIVKIGEQNITMDFNHPLAGEDLHFVGKVVEVREPSEKELKQFMGGCNCGESDCEGCGSEADDLDGGCSCGCGH